MAVPLMAAPSSNGSATTTAVGQLLDTIYDVKKFTNRGLDVIGVLPTLFDGRTTHGRTVLERIGDDYSCRSTARHDLRRQEIHQSRTGRDWRTPDAVRWPYHSWPHRPRTDRRRLQLSVNCSTRSTTSRNSPIADWT